MGHFLWLLYKVLQAKAHSLTRIKVICISTLTVDDYCIYMGHRTQTCVNKYSIQHCYLCMRVSWWGVLIINMKLPNLSHLQWFNPYCWLRRQHCSNRLLQLFRNISKWWIRYPTDLENTTKFTWKNHEKTQYRYYWKGIFCGSLISK